MSKSLVIRGVLLMLGFLLLCDILLADEAQTKVAGNWLTQPRDGIIQISQAPDGTLQGRIVGGNEPGKLDHENPDVAKRNLPLRGQVIMSGLKYDGDGKWSGGSIYDPASGSSYKCKIELTSDGGLKVRGFVGIALLGKTQHWTRYMGTSMDLPKAPWVPSEFVSLDISAAGGAIWDMDAWFMLGSSKSLRYQWLRQCNTQAADLSG